ncbi:MAG: hypothetical protein HC848_11250 [Limnobacter sp.]|nr:hypothetical protein [Limnobacter sp.]
MSLATRCPACKTLFKVSLGQLQVHEGQVRCGQCKAAFSGIDHLAAADSELWEHMQLEDNEPPAMPAQPAPATPANQAAPPFCTGRKAQEAQPATALAAQMERPSPRRQNGA